MMNDLNFNKKEDSCNSTQGREKSARERGIECMRMSEYVCGRVRDVSKKRSESILTEMTITAQHDSHLLDLEAI